MSLRKLPLCQIFFFDIVLVEYLATPLGRIRGALLNWLVSQLLNIVHKYLIGSRSDAFQKLSASLL